jgi:hypothetical protein
VPILYERDEGRRRITAVSVGAVTLADTLAILDRQAAEGAWSYGMLHDARAGTSVPSAADIQRVVQHVGKLTTKHGPRGPVALVVSDRALSRMGAVYANLGELTALEVRVFSTLGAAAEWLDGVDGG